MLSKVQTVFTQFDLQLWILFAGWIISSMGFAMVVPFVSIYFHLELGVSMSLVGTFFLVTALVRAFSQILAGNLSDSVGRKKIMVFAQIFRGVIFFGVAISIAHSWGFWPTALILVSGYLLASFFQPVANAMVADIVPAEKRPEAYGFLKIAANIGWGIGPAAGGFLTKNSYASLFWVAGSLALISGITITLFIRESNMHRQEFQRTHFLPANLFRVFSDTQFLQYCMVSLMMFLTMAQLIATLSVYARDTVGLTNPELGWVYSTNAFIVVFFQLFVSKAIRGRNLLQVLMMGSFLYSVGYSLMAIPDSLAGILVLIGLITLAEMMVGPASTSMVAKIAADKKNGQYMGAFGLFGTLGWSLGPFIGGLLLDFAPNATLLWSGVSLFGLMGAAGYFWLNTQYPGLRR